MRGFSEACRGETLPTGEEESGRHATFRANPRARRSSGGRRIGGRAALRVIRSVLVMSASLFRCEQVDRDKPQNCARESSALLRQGFGGRGMAPIRILSQELLEGARKTRSLQRPGPAVVPAGRLAGRHPYPVVEPVGSVRTRCFPESSSREACLSRRSPHRGAGRQPTGQERGRRRRPGCAAREFGEGERGRSRPSADPLEECRQG